MGGLTSLDKLPQGSQSESGYLLRAHSNVGHSNKLNCVTLRKREVCVKLSVSQSLSVRPLWGEIHDTGSAA
jgi:hypothetical protein